MKEHIQLQSANMFQITNDTSGKTDWKIRENKTDKVLFELSKRITDNDMFDIMEFARKYELIAFNAGITFGNKKTTAPLHDEIKYLRNKLTESIEHSDKLALKLQSLLISEE